jgi:hypothetical protein
MAVEYVVDYVGHGVIEYGDDQQARPTHSGLLHISLGEHCNERASAGWRLVSVIGSTAGPLVFFERESRRLEMP